MPPEKFKIANAVVKAESTLLSLLEGTSNLSYEEKTKVVDRIHVRKKQKIKKYFGIKDNYWEYFDIDMLLQLFSKYLMAFMVV